MELSKIAVRALFSYLLLLTLMRLSGKDSIGQHTAMEFVLVLILGDMIDDLLWAEVPAAQFVVGVTTLVIVQLLVAFGNHVSPWFARLINGGPTLILRDGVPHRPGLRSLRMNLQEVKEMLRGEGISPDEWESVQSAYVEKEGAVSVIMQPWARPAQRADAERLRRSKR